MLSLSFIKEIEKIIGRENVLTGEADRQNYAYDAAVLPPVVPGLVVRPTRTDQLGPLIQKCYEEGIPITIRGSGTNLSGGTIPDSTDAVIILTNSLDRILEINEEEMYAVVEPGVITCDLAAAVAARGLFYPPDPGEKSATIGGNISTNAGGMRAVKYGVTRDFVRALTVVLPNGEVIEPGGKVVKNSSGYDLLDLVIGSEGTLGIITGATLRLLPLPTVSMSLLVPFETMDEALLAVPEIIKSKTEPTAIEYMSRETILFAEDFLSKKFPDDSHEAYLLLTFDGSDQKSVESSYEKVAELCLEMGAYDAYFVDTEERKKSVWSARGAFLEAIKASTDEMDECDVVVPRSRIADFIKFTHHCAKEVGLRIPSFGHAGDGNLHVYICRDGAPQDEWDLKLKKAFDLMYEKANELGGKVSGEHGIGFAKKEYLKASLTDAEIVLMQGIKKTFDPKNILNPDKVI